MSKGGEITYNHPTPVLQSVKKKEGGAAKRNETGGPQNVCGKELEAYRRPRPFTV